MKSKIFREKSLAATALMIILTAVVFVAGYAKIADLIEQRCLQRMEEGVDSTVYEVTQKLSRDSQILNAAADILANMNSFDVATMQETIRIFEPLLRTQKINILLPDDTLIYADGSIGDGSNTFDFQELARRGEHVSNPGTSIEDENTRLLRHYVPIVHNGETVAILYGRTMLDELPETLNIDYIYNASASVYLIEQNTGEFIIDTRNELEGAITDFPIRYTKGISWQTAIDQIKSGASGYVLFKSERTGMWQYLYYRPAEINNWTVAISVPRDEAFSNLYSIQHIFEIMAAAIAVTFILYFLWLRKKAKQATEEAVEKAVLQEKLQKAEAAERAKTMFLSNMSHDIRTPMNAIIGFTALAQSNLDKKERLQDYLGKIMSAGNHLLSLINDVLDMSRIESGKLNIEEKPCSIPEIFRDMRNIIQTQIRSKQLEFFMDTQDVVDEDIYCDKLHVNQVLLNLLSNAVKFTPAGGSVAVHIRQLPEAPEGYGAYEIRVKDTGIGMSPEFAERIFEPFERERNSTVSGIQGTGLGMAISKSIVDAMGGTISVKTEQGKGTEFIVRLDFRLQPERRQVEDIEELRGMRALVVDDNFEACDSMTKMLAQIGLKAEWTMHGKEAVLKARQAQEMGDGFGVYIVDWMMPDLSGIEVVRRIRSFVGKECPIIAVTAYDWSNMEDEALQAGVSAFCSKPVFLSDLHEILLSIVSDAAKKEEGPVMPEAADALKGKRLLLVEDNELNREIAEELLTESGFVIETAEDGTIAVEKVSASEPGWYDLVLMDIQMPIMNGYDATRAIRALKDPALANIPIVAMTANAFEEDKQQALAAGMNDHVTKPIDTEKLMKVLNTQLGAPTDDQ